jgi:hypothetical protein
VRGGEAHALGSLVELWRLDIPDSAELSRAESQ